MIPIFFLGILGGKPKVVLVLGFVLGLGLRLVWGAASGHHNRA